MNKNDELSRLAAMLHHTQQRIVELTGGAVDAVVDPSGTSYLLPRAQEQLRRSATQRSAILNALPAHVAVLGQDGRIVEVNETWRRFAVDNGFASDHFGVGDNYVAVCERSNDSLALDAASGIRAVLSGERPEFSLEYPCHSPAVQRWFRLLATSVGDADFSGAVVMHIDITERRTLEEQLRQSQRLESLGELTGGIAHDFNNLLTVISGNAELLQERLADEEDLNPLVEMIAHSARRGAELTHRLLAFARRQVLQPRVIDINHVVAGMEPILRRTLGEHVETTLIHGPGLWPVLVDPGQLESAVLNICINSRDAMPSGGKLVIETGNVRVDEDYSKRHADIQPGEYVRLSISDTGKGIAAKDLDRVFEPFFTTKSIGKGTGLGLSMVYGFTKQSRGSIRICSAPGEGTTLMLYLPRSIAPLGQASVPEAELPCSGGSETILLVEDDPMVRKYVETQLADLGYHVLTATDGPQALALLRTTTDIDLLFTDILMRGGMNGNELATSARELQPGLKVLYTSGYTQNAMGEPGTLAPDALFLGKPYRRGELARMVRTALSDHRD